MVRLQLYLSPSCIYHAVIIGPSWQIAVLRFWFGMEWGMEQSSLFPRPEKEKEKSLLGIIKKDILLQCIW